MNSIPTREQETTDRQVFEAFDLSLPQLAGVRDAWEKGDVQSAKQLLAEYFHGRRNVRFLYDYRGRPLRPMEPDECPYAYQSALGLSGKLKDFCLYVGRHMMENIYVRPGWRGEVDLGKNFENMIHFSFLTDQGKRHRNTLDMFVRGQFFESMAVLYHETGDEAVTAQFCRVLKRFFETYPLEVVDTSPGANRFQFTEDRDVMSVGWLCVVFISLLYTELPYAAGSDVVFELLRHIWFLGIQFRRFDTDSFRQYNHHMWERGLVPFLLSVLLPEIPEFAAMRERGALVVRRHVMEDFNAHGGYSEHSIAYWSGAALGEMISRGVNIARLNNVPLLDEESMRRVDRSLDLLAQLCPPAQRYPSLGDNGGPLIEPILRLGVSMTDNAFCKEMLSVRAGGADTGIVPLDLCDDTAGFVCLHSDHSPRQNYLLMSAKNNCGYTGHNHMDMLSVFLTVRGEAFFGEPYLEKLYHSVKMNSPQRGFMYNMSSHNTVLAYSQPVAPDKMYANKWGVYRPDSPVKTFWSERQGAYVEAYHTGYTFCRPSRSILFARAGGVLLRDVVQRGNRMPEPHLQRWYLEPGCKVSPVGDKALTLEKNGVKILCVWRGECSLALGDLHALLYPDIIADEAALAPVLNVAFTAPENLQAENASASLELLVLDVTQRPLPDPEALRGFMAGACADMAQPETLSRLTRLCTQGEAAL